MSDHQWTVITQGNNATCLLDNGTVAASFYLPWGETLARRVAAALNGTADVTALATPSVEAILARVPSEYRFGMNVTDWTIETIRDATIAAARALVASTGTETDE